jgi:hypothetical protein
MTDLVRRARKTAAGDEWAPIPGYDNYLISDHGAIYSIQRRRTKGGILVQAVTAGYYRVALYSEGKKRSELVHRLVLLAFDGGPPNDDFQAAHLDGNKLFNWLSNLIWCSRSENERHKLEHGTMVRGERTYNAKLTESQVIELRLRHKRGERPSSLLAEYGVSRGCVHNIIYRRNWKHV